LYNVKVIQQLFINFRTESVIGALEFTTVHATILGQSVVWRFLMLLKLIANFTRNTATVLHSDSASP